LSDNLASEYWQALVILLRQPGFLRYGVVRTKNPVIFAGHSPVKLSPVTPMSTTAHIAGTNTTVATSTVANRSRIASIDTMHGLVIPLMMIDHVRERFARNATSTG